jgi:hypothetical protein
MLKHLKSFLIAIFIPPIILSFFDNIVFASYLNPYIPNLVYWYYYYEVRVVIANLIGDRSYIAPNSTALINDGVAAALNK